MSQKGSAYKAVLAMAALGLSSIAALADAPAVTPVVTGTVHEAYFGIASHGHAVIAVGAAGAIRESADDGKTWIQAVSPAGLLSLMGVSIAQNHRLAVGQLGTVIRLEKDGKWVASDSGVKSRLFAVSVNDAGVAAAVGEFGTVIKSSDGGVTWTAITPDWSKFAEEGVQPHVYDVYVAADGTITTAGEFGLILRSKDGGTTWQGMHKGDASLFALDLTDPAQGFAVGQDGTVLRTTDGGTTWNTIDAGTDAILLGVGAGSDGRIVATGIRDMLVSSDRGVSWQHVSTPEVAVSWYQGVAKSPTGGGLFAVGHSGEIVRIGS